MKKTILFIFVCVLSFAFSGSGQTKKTSQTKLYEVCGNPQTQCDAADVFDSWDLPFNVSGELEWFGEYKSKPFYAVILQSRKVIPESHPNDDNYQECGGQFTEDERLDAQKLFPNNKVFSTRFGCYYFTHSYTNVNANYNFMAVFGGTTTAQAQAVLKKVKALKKYPGANIRRMQAILCNMCH